MSKIPTYINITLIQNKLQKMVLNKNIQNNIKNNLK